MRKWNILSYICGLLWSPKRRLGTICEEIWISFNLVTIWSKLLRVTQKPISSSLPTNSAIRELDQKLSDHVSGPIPQWHHPEGPPSTAEWLALHQPKNWKTNSRYYITTITLLKATYTFGLGNWKVGDPPWPSDYDAWLPSLSSQVRVSAGSQSGLAWSLYKCAAL